jgi:hypothetical protein
MRAATQPIACIAEFSLQTVPGQIVDVGDLAEMMGFLVMLEVIDDRV